jgi:hypothetical protein
MLEALLPRAQTLRLLACWPDVTQYAALLDPGGKATTSAGARVRFVAPGEIADSHSYEQRIYQTGMVVTRERNWHDLLNAMVWVRFPRTKATINARHVAEQHARPSAGNRNRVQDTLTLFDESGVLVASDDESLLSALRQMRWKELFWQRRADVVARMRFFPFGHGLCEQALRPFIGLTGKALLLQVEADVLALPLEAQLRVLDARLARWIDAPDNLLSPAALCPLPVLGVPGWWRDNERESFYDNTQYFRSRRRAVHIRRNRIAPYADR